MLLAVILVAYRHSAWGMAMIWTRSDTYAHGFVVPIISLWLVWRQRAVLAPMVPRPGRLAWLLMAGAAALWLAGDLVAVNAATQLALTTLIAIQPTQIASACTAWCRTYRSFLYGSIKIAIRATIPTR
jgi:hypothetical protein